MVTIMIRFLLVFISAWGFFILMLIGITLTLFGNKNEQLTGAGIIFVLIFISTGYVFWHIRKLL